MKTAPKEKPADWVGTLPGDWTGGEGFVKFWRGHYVHLYSLKKSCQQCGGEMKIDVTRAAIEGTAKNSGLKLTRCQGCRASTKITHSRPYVEGERKDFETATDKMLSENAIMKEELTALYAEVKRLNERLAKYELPAAMESLANGAPTKMPWEI